MEIVLSPSWILTDEYSSSSYGKPVLVHRAAEGQAYGPGDIVNPYPSWGLQPASHAVKRFLKINQGKMTEDENAFGQRFFL